MTSLVHFSHIHNHVSDTWVVNTEDPNEHMMAIRTAAADSVVKWRHGHTWNSKRIALISSQTKHNHRQLSVEKGKENNATDWILLS